MKRFIYFTWLHKDGPSGIVVNVGDIVSIVPSEAAEQDMREKFPAAKSFIYRRHCEHYNACLEPVTYFSQQLGAFSVGGADTIWPYGFSRDGS